MAKSKVFRVKDEQRRLLDMMKVFFGLGTHNAVFKKVVILGALDIAAQPEDPTWSKAQKRAWVYCREVAKAAKAVLQNGRENYR